MIVTIFKSSFQNVKDEIYLDEKFLSAFNDDNRSIRHVIHVSTQ